MVDDEIYRKVQSDLVKYARMLHARGYIVASEGNLSARVPPGDRILITPGDLRVLDLDEKDLVLVGLDGTKIAGDHEPSREHALHLSIYVTRPEVHAIIHAHPPYTTAYSFEMPRFYKPMLPELQEGTGNFGFIPYRPPGTLELADTVKERCSDCSVLILQKHGLVTLDKSLDKAFDSLERVEFEFKVSNLRKGFR
jgi:L-fuculose-phosphate aldolase